MRQFGLITLVATLIIGCAPRTVTEITPAFKNTRIQNVFFTTLRSPGQGGQIFGEDRVPELRYGSIDISIPPTHETGQLEWTSETPNPAKEFAITKFGEFDSAQRFVQEVQKSQTDTPDETVVFVHGYNTTAVESVFRLAQIQEDFDMPDPSVLFSWPSAGQAAGYVYDRDSVLFARDDLETVLTNLTRGNKKVFLTAHSMGSQLVMETLRQMKLKGNTHALNNLTGVVLMSPDIDQDVFKRQAAAIGTLPQPFVIFSAQQDKALSISALLTGRKSRVGVVSNNDALGRDDVTVIDFSQFASNSELNHFLVATSPAAGAFLQNLVHVSDTGQREFAAFISEPTLAN